MSPIPKEGVRIVVSMAATCLVGAAVLGGVYVATARHAEEQTRASERREIAALLALDGPATLLEVRQSYAPERGEVVYRLAGLDGGDAQELVFDRDGVLRSRGPERSGATSDEALRPLGRMFVARRGGAPAGFVVEGVSQGYKNRIRFLVGLRPDFTVSGVRVVEHEEDPGLGAEVATPEFQGQFQGRANPAALDVTRDPMPEDWRAALVELRRLAPETWRARHGALIDRERDKPIYAVTGATISSRALTSGVCVSIERFRRRWERLAPYVAENRP
jgi:electron transport complex protein RnfG